MRGLLGFGAGLSGFRFTSAMVWARFRLGQVMLATGTVFELLGQATNAAPLIQPSLSRCQATLYMFDRLPASDAALAMGLKLAESMPHPRLSCRLRTGDPLRACQAGLL